MTFVDDKRHYTNTLTQQLSKIVIEAMEKSVTAWYELLQFVGGDLELTKCGWYVIDWGLDGNDKPYMQITTPQNSLIKVLKNFQCMDKDRKHGTVEHTGCSSVSQ